MSISAKNYLRALSFVLVNLIFFTAAFAQPKVFIEQKDHSFGTVVQGTVVQHAFAVENKGTEPLLIHSVRAQCGCTAATPPGGAILPGAKAPITVVMDTTGFDGQKEKSVRVFTNDPEQSFFDLYIKGNVEGGLNITPPRVQVGEVRLSSGVIKKPIEISVKSISNLKLLSVNSTSQSVKITDLALNETSAKFTVEFLPVNLQGSFLEKIFVTADNKGKQQQYVIPVVGKVLGTLIVEPKIISLGVINPSSKELIKRQIKISTPSPEKKLLINKINVTDSSIQASVKEVKKNSSYIIYLTVDPAKVKKDIQATLSVVTSDTLQPNIDITVYGVLPPA